MVHQTDEDTGIYEIGAVAELIGEHPETLRVWERNGLVRPDRSQYRRRYSNNDLKRLRFIKQLLDEGGLNLAGIRLVTQMYPCWYIRRCKGGASRSSKERVNAAKPCWKEEGTYCRIVADLSELCSSCDMVKRCHQCNGCKE